MNEGDAIPDLVGWEYHGPPLRRGPDLVVLASGAAQLRGAAPFAATLYAGPKGNLVFNAGTCWWSMVLSSPPASRTRRTRTSPRTTRASSG